MNYPKTMLFVDGENLVFRYQNMVKDGYMPKTKVTHVPDCFIWHPDITEWSMFDIIRVNYYTSTTGDAPRVEALKKQIAAIEYSFQYTFDEKVPHATAQLVPQVFHKQSKNLKTRNVDIQLTIDVMRAANLSNVEIIYILSGDGDYAPLIDEVMRHGKQVYLSAFSSGLNTRLSYSVDCFELLDKHFFAKHSKK